MVCAPRPVIARLVNVATPFTAATVTVPLNAPLPLNTAAVTLAVLVVRLPPASRISTTGCVENATPVTAPLGCVVIASCVAAPAVTLKLDDVVPVRPEAENERVCGP